MKNLVFIFSFGAFFLLTPVLHSEEPNFPFPAAYAPANIQMHEGFAKMKTTLQNQGYFEDKDLLTIENQINQLAALIRKTQDLQSASRILDFSTQQLKDLFQMEGYDVSVLLRRNEDRSVKGVRNQLERVRAGLRMLKQIQENKRGVDERPVMQTFYEFGSVKLCIAVLNPANRAITLPMIKADLPKEIIPDDIVNLEGFKAGHDPNKEAFFVYQENLPLGAHEMKIWTVLLEDVWQISEKEIQREVMRADAILRSYEGLPYYEDIKPIINSIHERIQRILELQSDFSISGEEHMGVYRLNRAILDQSRSDLSFLERMRQQINPAKKRTQAFDSPIQMPVVQIIFAILFLLIFFGLALAVKWMIWRRYHHPDRPSKEDDHPEEWRKAG